MEVSLATVRPGAPHEGVVLPVSDVTQVGEARRALVALGARLGFDEVLSGKLAIVVTEAAGNLVKHAHGGELVVRELGPGRRGLEVIALDRGPGIADVARALQDGYSTSGTPGGGLGAIRRLTDEFDLYSSPGRGTAVFSRVVADDRAPGPIPRLQAGAICLPMAREEVSGDAWDVRHTPEGARLLVVDGLGHGPDAHRAARRVMAAAFEERGGPGAVVGACHDALRSTRGAALAVAEVHAARSRVRYAGVGNVTGSILGAARRQNMVSVNGTAGQGTLRVREFEYSWDPASVLVMASDGLGTRWSLDDYPGLASRHPALVAAVLYRDHGRGRDDVTVLAVRERPAGAPA